MSTSRQKTGLAGIMVRTQANQIQVIETWTTFVDDEAVRTENIPRYINQGDDFSGEEHDVVKLIASTYFDSL